MLSWSEKIKRPFRLVSACLFVLLLVGCCSGASPHDRASVFSSLYGRVDDKCEILFQAFTWNAAVDGQKFIWYRHMLKKGRDLADSGITLVWFPPCARSVSPQGYMPGDWYDLGYGQALGHNRTLYGNKAELRECITEYHKLGMKCIADLVLNHRCASHRENGVWNVFHHASGKAWWEKWALAEGDYNGTGAPDTGLDFAAAADIDHTNSRVRKDIIDWMHWLRTELGFDGWRFDYAKGYAAGYAALYTERSGVDFAVAEYWTDMAFEGSYLLPDQDAHRQKLCDWLDEAGGSCRVFDFTTKGILQWACKTGEYWRLKDKRGKAAGLIGWWPDRAVTFIDNHDTGSTQAHWPFPADKVMMGYAYILTHPGTPTVFWDHMYAWGENYHRRIRELCLYRHRLGIHRNSRLEIIEARQSLYVAKIDDRTLLRLGSAEWAPGAASWKIALRGPGYTVWTRK